VKINWEKLGLKGTPKSLRDVWNGRNVETANETISVAAHDLALMIVDGEDKAPKEYAANGHNISGISATGGFTFARLQYANTSGHVVVVPVKSTSGLFTGLALAPTVGSESGTIGLILPHGTADLSFEGQAGAIRRLDVYAW
jgi:Alpha galactosidase C-terminal beta sandwich domain